MTLRGAYSIWPRPRLLSGLILMLVWPAGRAVAVHAALIVLVIHLLLGPYAAGQRDYLMSIAALGAASGLGEVGGMASPPLALPGAGGRVRRHRGSDQTHWHPATGPACGRNGRGSMARRGLDRGRCRRGRISIARIFGAGWLAVALHRDDRRIAATLRLDRVARRVRRLSGHLRVLGPGGGAGACRRAGDNLTKTGRGCES